MRMEKLASVRGAAELTGGGPALFRLVRYWSRRWTVTQDAEPAGHVLVLEAIDAAAATGAKRASMKGAAVIGEVAVELGLDRSNASRMLSAAVSAGLVVKTVSPEDARRTELALTPAGDRLLADARAWQDQTFATLVADWPAADARLFAIYLKRLAAQEVPHDHQT
jgi:DNA-binding MarR family transcriptional regulator